MIKNVLLNDDSTDKFCSVNIIVEKIFLTSNIEDVIKNKLEYCSLDFGLDLCLRVSIDGEIEELKYVFILSRFAYESDDFSDKPEFYCGRKADLIRNFGTNQFKEKKYSTFLNQFVNLVDSQNFPRELDNQEISLENLPDILINFNSYKDFIYGIDDSLEISPKNLNVRNWMFDVLDQKTITQHLKSTIEIRTKKQILFSGSFDEVTATLKDKKSVQLILSKRKRLNSDFDFRDMTDWSNYDDNLDNDQQSPEFWNQF